MKAVSRTLPVAERPEFSDNQIPALGIFAETLNAWVGPCEQLSAQLATPIRSKTDPASGNKPTPLAVSQIVTISGRLQNGALASEAHTGLALDTSTLESEITIWGLNGTLR